MALDVNFSVPVKMDLPSPRAVCFNFAYVFDLTVVLLVLMPKNIRWLNLMINSVKFRKNIKMFLPTFRKKLMYDSKLLM